MREPQEGKTQVQQPEPEIQANGRVRDSARNDGKSATTHPGMGMEALAQQVQQHYLSPYQAAQESDPPPFPAPVLRGLGLGALSGGGLGLLIGILLYNGVLVVPGLEVLYAATSVTFYTFWTMAGVAAGIVLLGVGTVLAAPLDSTGSSGASATNKTTSGE